MAAWVYAVRLEDGSLIWKAPNGEGPGGAGFTSHPVLVGDVVVFGRQNSQVEAWDVNGSGRVWTWDVPSGVTDLVARGPFVYSTQGFIVIGDAGGNVRWRYGSSGYFRGNVAEDGMIYLLYAGPMLGHGTFIQAIRPPISP
jgi:outer membrane protein assembly factor BamB